MTNDTELEPVQDWRKRLRELPRGEEPAPSRFVTWLSRAATSATLFVVGSIFLIFSGAFLGLSLGIGPEHTGGGAYFLSGSLCTVAAGAILALLVPKPAGAPRLSRLVFYSFTAPSLVVLLLMFL